MHVGEHPPILIFLYWKQRAQLWKNVCFFLLGWSLRLSHLFEGTSISGVSLIFYSLLFYCDLIRSKAFATASNHLIILPPQRHHIFISKQPVFWNTDVLFYVLIFHIWKQTSNQTCTQDVTNSRFTIVILKTDKEIQRRLNECKVAYLGGP